MGSRRLLVALLAAAVFAYAALGRGSQASRLLVALERVAGTLSRRPLLTGIGLALTLMAIRVALTPWWPIPLPYIYDEFSYLLQADTFAHGRLSNPTHPLWQFFESIYIIVKPTYASRYPPGQAIAMAAGQVLFGNPWYGVVMSAGALFWALWWANLGWLPRRWALWATALATPLCLSTYWMNSYWGGAVTAIGGTLVTGGFARIVLQNQAVYAWVMGAGFAILMLTRPFEGLLLAVVLLLFLIARTRALSVWPPIGVCVVATGSFIAYDNYRITGNPTRLPYQEYSAQYEAVPPFTFAAIGAPRHYGHFNLEYLDQGWTRQAWDKAHSWQFLMNRPKDWFIQLSILLGTPFWLLILIYFCPALWRAKKMRPLVVAIVAMLAGSFLEVTWFAHYAAPFTACIFIAVVQGLRYLQIWRFRGQRWGFALARALPVAMLSATLGGTALQVGSHTTADQILPQNARRQTVADRLMAEHPGRHVVFVQYTDAHLPHAEWIHNPADIDAQSVVWAQDMGELEDVKLIQYYPGRQFWLFKPDEGLDKITPVR